MAVITATNIIDNAARQLFDVDNIKWSRIELLSYLNDGQRTMVALMPECTGTTANLLCASGSKQTLPTDGWMLLEVTRNMGTTGTTPGRAVKFADRAILDETQPTWYTATATTQTLVYMYDVRNRTSFYVSPPSSGTNYLEIVYSKIPVDISTEATAITVADVYAAALMDYVLFRAYSKNADFADKSYADMHFTAFNMVVGKSAVTQSKLAQQMDQLLAPASQVQGSVGGN